MGKLYKGEDSKMLRGVNKNIIEISNIEGGYFDKVLFFVKEDRRSEPDSVLNTQAEKYVAESSALKYKKSFSPGAKTAVLMKMALSAGAGFALGLIILL